MTSDHPEVDDDETVKGFSFSSQVLEFPSPKFVAIVYAFMRQSSLFKRSKCSTGKNECDMLRKVACAVQVFHPYLQISEVALHF